MRYDEAGNLDYPTMSAERITFKADARGLKFAIVVARFNSAVTEKLLEGAREALKKAGSKKVAVFRVPGAFELPLAAKKLAKSYDAIVALGAVIRGETPHFEYVAGAAAHGLQQVALETTTPVSFGVLTTNTLAEAEARAGGAHGNKGYDAAMTAIEMAHFGKKLGKKSRK
jgi:6,7-dimethyl-8-ribityllumazine synthase